MRRFPRAVPRWGVRGNQNRQDRRVVTRAVEILQVECVVPRLDVDAEFPGPTLRKLDVEVTGSSERAKEIGGRPLQEICDRRSEVCRRICPETFFCDITHRQRGTFEKGRSLPLRWCQFRLISGKPLDRPLKIGLIRHQGFGDVKGFGDSDGSPGNESSIAQVVFKVAPPLGAVKTRPPRPERGHAAYNNLPSDNTVDGSDARNQENSATATLRGLAKLRRCSLMRSISCSVSAVR